jgi:hypothetical protein
MYNPEVGEYRRGNQNVQSQRLENTEGAITMYNPEVGEYRRGNQNVQSQRLENTEGAITMYNPEVGDCPFGILQPLDCTL